MTSEPATLVHDTHTILYGDEASGRMFRCSSEHLVGKNIAEIIATEEFRHLARIHMQVLRERGDSPTIEYPFMRCDASVFWANASSERLDDKWFILTLKITFEEWWL